MVWCVAAAAIGLVRETLNPAQMKLQVVSMLSFPIVGTAWKAYQQAVNYPHSGIPNRLQHLIWAATMVGLLLPVLVLAWRKLSTRTVLLQTLVCISAIGFAGEIGEFLIHTNHSYQAATQYFLSDDTLVDILMNAIGGSITAAYASHLRKDSDPVPTLRVSEKFLPLPLI